MAEYITAIRTTDGDKKIDYRALANLPDATIEELNRVAGVTLPIQQQLDTIGMIYRGAPNLANMDDALNFISLVESADCPQGIYDIGGKTFYNIKDAALFVHRIIEPRRIAIQCMINRNCSIILFLSNSFI